MLTISSLVLLNLRFLDVVDEDYFSLQLHEGNVLLSLLFVYVIIRQLY